MLWTLLFFCLIGTSAQNQGASCTTGKLIEGGKTTQSSTFKTLSSDKAVDGIYYLCAHTREEPNSWWTIDLLGLYEISCININNTVAENIDLTNAQILIGNSSDGNFDHHKVCTTISVTTNGKNLTFQCDNGPMSGRYVTVHLERTFFVILCEVKIYATKKHGLMLVQENRTWEEALYHCRDLNMDLVSILDEDTQGWVELEARKADSPYVWLWFCDSAALDTDDSLEKQKVYKFRGDLAVRHGNYQSKEASNTCHLTSLLLLKVSIYEHFGAAGSKTLRLQQLCSLLPFNPWHWFSLGQTCLQLLENKRTSDMLLQGLNYRNFQVDADAQSSPFSQVMSEDLIPEKMREDDQDGETLISVCLQSFRERWWNKILLTNVLETDETHRYKS
ncbi:uncharacterized protein LOC125016057 [Mugil cephalus]|uniref:uncharacterized protein LOC125016057 n=1 Tax=Mugil cephalus TaxID=48193 RepID=UPI001FB8599E|nr:uncharacterized protein LOC125016057 [Mugil cephalus]